MLQLGYVDRIPSFLDIASNTCGAVISYVIKTLLRTSHDPRSLRLYRPVTVAAIPIAILGTLMLLHPPATVGLLRLEPGVSPGSRE